MTRKPREYQLNDAIQPVSCAREEIKQAAETRTGL